MDPKLVAMLMRLGAGMAAFENLLAQTMALALREHPDPERAIREMRDNALEMMKATEPGIHSSLSPGVLPEGAVEGMFDDSLATVHRVLDGVAALLRR